ncbi:tRNA (adenosine(37)-N6)-dimethylallyltransferase MiaA [Salibacterium halotolerans]|uniref:tRNA dimethylallyltransferase n=1 Tax=Salibacterium halotolerans TaxID=1884432 RepID=A0A1I5UYC4_9BACI|nr:tRNA (adenosine(37)-N6)-dimethylallyltransferase MiaA [Salibacterium halotolerans]SFQ00220.1 tRNA dimethylallyltransferase [Salibacterium halotolerans]
MTKDKVVVIAGPTAVGKSETAIRLASYFDGEILSGDSMQIYKGLDIGTAKVSENERRGIPHYFIDERRPDDSYSAASFQQKAAEHIRNINARGKLPIIAGGTGLYIRAVIRGLDFHDTPSDPEFRREMEEFARNHGARSLHDKLREMDEENAARIHPNNVKKTVRALEIRHIGGQTKRSFESEDDMFYHHLMIGLTMERSTLYQRINTRVDQMIKEGLPDEAKWLFDKYPRDVQAAQAIGYKEFFPYFEGRCTFTEAVETLKQHSRQYAKRQLTWFRNKERVNWFDMTDGLHEEKINKMIQLIEGEYDLPSNT